MKTLLRGHDDHRHGVRRTRGSPARSIVHLACNCHHDRGACRQRPDLTEDAGLDRTPQSNCATIHFSSAFISSVASSSWRMRPDRSRAAAGRHQGKGRSARKVHASTTWAPRQGSLARAMLRAPPRETSPWVGTSPRVGTAQLATRHSDPPKEGVPRSVSPFGHTTAPFQETSPHAPGQPQVSSISTGVTAGPRCLTHRPDRPPRRVSGRAVLGICTGFLSRAEDGGRPARGYPDGQRETRLRTLPGTSRGRPGVPLDVATHKGRHQLPPE